jgi:low affinity Fe/Cu permease
VPGWAVSGPIFNYSDTWQLVINTGTTIITFLMAFVIQESQNKDTMALQLKLNELIAALEKAGQIYFRENTGGKINTHIHF